MIDVKRYRRVRCFFAKALLKTLWWDILLTWPLLRLLRTDPIPRWQEIARQFRSLAIEMGGVLIKLGQFLSIRVDILPVEVTSELAGLQDEVPAEKSEDIAARIEADFGRPIGEIFAWFCMEPLGAASLAQVHRVRLHSGEEAVVKVLRPGIEVLVETDLKAIALAFRWLKWYKRLRLRVDLDWLAEEFTAVTRRELDFKSEASNAERLASDFSEDSDIYIPQFYKDLCGTHTLTMENVGYIKISDLNGIEAAGIRRSEVADTLHRIYMKQVFETNFVHVDPHPGNLFVKPLPVPEEIETGITDFPPDVSVPFYPGRPFQLAFVDFGMSVSVPSRLRSAIREYAIALGTRDAHRMVQSYVNAGTLLEGADLKRLEEAHEAVFQRFWGVRVGQFKTIGMKEIRQFMKDYRDVIYEAPFQFQADMLFVVRAIGILSGMAANLDPEFDPWTKTIPYAERFAKEELHRELPDQLLSFGQSVVGLPSQLERLITDLQRGRLTLQTSLAPDALKAARRIEQAIRYLAQSVAAAALLFSGVSLWKDHPHQKTGILLMLLSAIMYLWKR